MKTHTEFIHIGDETLCLLKKGDIETVGASKCHSDDKEHLSKMTGETIAYYRAIEKYYKDKLVTTNKEIRILKKAYTYIFPKKLTGQGIEIVKYRYDKYMKEKEKEKQSYIDNITMIRKTCENYIEGKQKIREKIAENKKV